MMYSFRVLALKLNCVTRTTHDARGRNNANDASRRTFLICPDFLKRNRLFVMPSFLRHCRLPDDSRTTRIEAAEMCCVTFCIWYRNSYSFFIYSDCHSEIENTRPEYCWQTATQQTCCWCVTKTTTATTCSFLCLLCLLCVFFAPYLFGLYIEYCRYNTIYISSIYFKSVSSAACLEREFYRGLAVCVFSMKTRSWIIQSFRYSCSGGLLCKSIWLYFSCINVYFVYLILAHYNNKNNRKPLTLSS